MLSVPIFATMLIAAIDTTVLYLHRAEMWNFSRDVARRVAAGDISETDATQAVEDELYLYSDAYTVDTSDPADAGVRIIIQTRVLERLHLRLFSSPSSRGTLSRRSRCAASRSERAMVQRPVWGGDTAPGLGDALMAQGLDPRMIDDIDAIIQGVLDTDATVTPDYIDLTKEVIETPLHFDINDPPPHWIYYVLCGSNERLGYSGRQRDRARGHRC